MLDLADGEARAIGLDHERADATRMALLRVRHREDDVEVGDPEVRDPVLRTGDDPLVTVPDGLRDHPAWIRARLGLGESERGRPFPGGAAGQQALLHLIGAEQADRQGAELLHHEHQRRGGARLRDLLDRDVEHQRAGAGSAVLLLEAQTEQIVLGEQLAQIPGVLRLRVDLSRAGGHALTHDLADRVAEIDVLLGQFVDVADCLHRSAIVTRRDQAPMRPAAFIAVDRPGTPEAPQEEGTEMGIGTSVFLIAVGAILKWAVTDTIAGVSLATIGVILIVAGVIGLLFSLLFASAWADRRNGVVRDRVVERDVV